MSQNYALTCMCKMTWTFLCKIETVNENGPLPPNVILATMDVSSLYTNIPTQEGIDACCTFLTQEFTNDQLNSFCELMEIVLTCNNFIFDGDHYVQVFGTSMGTKMAPSMACLFMGSLEDCLLNSYSKKPSLWLRYIDDVFLLWTHGPEEFQNFVDHCNDLHHSIKFTAETSSHEIPFLDVMVSIKDGSLQNDLYSKPTDSYQFLHWTPCHPKHTKSRLPYGLAFCLNRICSTPATLKTGVTELKSFLEARGYPSGTVERKINKGLTIPCSEALKPTKTDFDTSLDRVPLVISYQNLHKSTTNISPSFTLQIFAGRLSQTPQ